MSGSSGCPTGASSRSASLSRTCSPASWQAATGRSSRRARPRLPGRLLRPLPALPISSALIDSGHNYAVPVITIGRQFGAGGATVGRMLADRLKADFLDSNIIDEVARRLQLPKEEVEAEDEQPGSLLARLLVALGSASTEPLIPPEATAWTPPNAAPTFDTRKAVLQITQHVIEEAARAGNVVIVGRGGAYILRDFPGALHVFLRAAEAARVKTITARFKISEEEARKRMKQTDENWTSYIKQVYGHDRNHPAHYDMVLDTGRLGYDATVEAILSALKTRKPIT